MHILIFGKTGQVGLALQNLLQPNYKVTALSRHNENGLNGDLSSFTGLSKTIAAIKPDIIINAAAYTQVDKAEAEPDLAYKINAEAPGVIATEANKINALLIHYSTDYVFDGSGSVPWQEADPTSPLNIYGKSKLDGENNIISSGCRHLIFRTSWVYDAQGKNFLRTMLTLAKDRDALNVIDDQIGSPTGAKLIAEQTEHALLQAINNPDLCGLYHLTASGYTSWHSYARHLIKTAIEAGAVLKTTPESVHPIPTSSYPTPARRPHNSRLNTQKFQDAFSTTLPAWEREVEETVKDILKKQNIS